LVSDNYVVGFPRVNHILIFACTEVTSYSQDTPFQDPDSEKSPTLHLSLRLEDCRWLPYTHVSTLKNIDYPLERVDEQFSRLCFQDGFPFKRAKGPWQKTGLSLSS
jgi:hypothetical protein